MQDTRFLDWTMPQSGTAKWNSYKVGPIIRWDWKLVFYFCSCLDARVCLFFCEVCRAMGRRWYWFGSLCVGQCSSMRWEGAAHHLSWDAKSRFFLTVFNSFFKFWSTFCFKSLSSFLSDSCWDLDLCLMHLRVCNPQHSQPSAGLCSKTVLEMPGIWIPLWVSLIKGMGPLKRQWIWNKHPWPNELVFTAVPEGKLHSLLIFQVPMAEAFFSLYSCNPSYRESYKIISTASLKQWHGRGPQECHLKSQVLQERHDQRVTFRMETIPRVTFDVTPWEFWKSAIP